METITIAWGILHFTIKLVLSHNTSVTFGRHTQYFTNTPPIVLCVNGYYIFFTNRYEISPMTSQMVFALFIMNYSVLLIEVVVYDEFAKCKYCLATHVNIS